MKPKTLRARSTQRVDLTAIKYIRIVIASYIMAVGLGMIQGFDASVYFSNFLTYPLALYASQVFVVFCALMLMFGYLLRHASLCLTIVILASSAQVNLIAPVQGSLDAFWADLVIACGLLACYWPLSAGQLRKQAFVQSTPNRSTFKTEGTQKIVPRRVTTRCKAGALLSGKRGVQLAAREGRSDQMAERLARLLVDPENIEGTPENIFA
jgi:uncharacterized membrane protein YphA (DoxX/SURF4 family)